MKVNNRKLVLLGLLLGVALILSFIEFLVPPIVPVPGFKIGLSQIGVLLAFQLYSIGEGAFVALSKTIFVSLLTGTFFTFIFWVGLSGAILSLPGLYLGKRLRFSIYSISILGAIGHNVGQLLFVGFTVSFSVVLFYLLYILAASLLAGALIGYVAKLLFPLLQRQFNEEK